jgi:uncharacterized iron-regulated membrane protein
MKGSFRQSMKWLHTWVGLVVGWILVFMFITGTCGYFYQEITRWMEPERPLAVKHLSKADLLDIGQNYLTTHAIGAEGWRIKLPNSRDGNLVVRWQQPAEDGERRGTRITKVLDTDTGLAVENIRATGGGNALYSMHYRLHYMPTIVAYWIVGICTMLMLIAVITGVIFHKKIFSDFFTYRAKKGLVGWLDIHNVLSVIAIPFHFMITYSGLLFFITTYMVLGFNLSFNAEQQDEFYDKVFPDTVTVKKADDYQPLASLSQMYQVTKEHWLQDTLEQVEVKYPLDKNARIKFTRKETDITYNPQDELFFAGISGVLLDVPDKPSTISGQIDDGFISLHEGQFATPIVRWLYLLVGLLGAGMVASGLILWTTKRKPKQVKKANGPDFGYRLVEQLNIGTIVGFPIAVAVYFWANRLLPISIENRGEWEMHCLFISWALLLIYPAFRPAINAWYEQLNLSAFMFCFIPLLNYMTTDKHLGVTLPQGDWNLAGFDLTMLVIGLAFAFAGYKVKKQITVKVRKTNNTTKDNIGKSIVTRRLTPLVTSKESQQ